MDEHATPDRGEARPPPSFRRRLLLTIGAGLAVALAALGVVVWLGLYAWMNRQAYAVLDEEARFVASQVVPPDGPIRPEAYAWNEPHHRFTGPHIDPLFLQLFDPYGRLLRQSDNVTFFPEGAYPARLFASETTVGPVPSLRTFDVAGQELYHLTRPLRDGRGRLAGYVQLARPYPGIDRTMRRTALLLLVGFGAVLAGLEGLVWWQAGRVLRPLDTITRATRHISAQRLSDRVPTPPGADRETAQLAATLNGQLARLEQAFEEMSRFTADAAHELQTPLTVLRGHVEVALRRPRPAEAYRDTLTLLACEIDGLTRTVRSLLGLARLDREGGTLPLAPADLSALVRDGLPAFEAIARDRGLSLRADAAEAAWVRGQPELLREVVANLVDNAVKYTRQGGVTVAVRAEEGAVRLVVRDTGVGMQPEEVRRATDRFYRAPSAGALDVSGSGLGLALVAQIVARHGGRLDLTSTPGGGTAVCVCLPAAVPPAGE